MAFGFGSDLSEEPVCRMLNRSRWTTESFLNVLSNPPFYLAVGSASSTRCRNTTLEIRRFNARTASLEVFPSATRRP